ncbi:lactonase family protein [Aestuariivivens marinum]|uniref:lactonase family protein n=1 Tax=Aestuariivivens marinum TaxID=2913555 RepID=UPI001F569470|nr:lactonase family protein [Aestuariivivens marinum]
MDSFVFYIGSYTKTISPEIVGKGEGIYTVELNNKTGELKLLHVESTVNPSYLVVDKHNKFLYCNTEVASKEAPKVKAYRIKNDFSLDLCNELPINGGFPCHIEKVEDHILVSCYETGNLLQFSLDESGRLSECVTNHKHSGSSSNKERQEAPHVHQVAIRPKTKEIYACDLGTDTLNAYVFDNGHLKPKTELDVNVTKGGGPRHMVFTKNGKFAYVVNELTGGVSILELRDGKLQHIDTINSLPSNYKGIPSASAIRIHPNDSYLYVGNRKTDTITIFKINDEQLQLIGHTYTGGKELREFNITPNGKWLIACHQDSHDTIVYLIEKDGTLTQKFATKVMKTPVCVAFLN